jgi:hypothetical protein
MRLLPIALLTACTSAAAPVCPPAPVAVAPAPAPPDQAFDAPDPEGDRRLYDTPGPGDMQADAHADEPPLRGFRCHHTFSSKGPPANGELVVTFAPRGPADARFEVSFLPGYTHAFTLVDGRADVADGVYAGGDLHFRCRRSPRSVFAVSCGPELGSELAVVVRGNGWGRTVGVRLPWFPSKTAATLPTGAPLPFVAYDREGHATGWAISFDRGDCALTPAG